MPDPERKLPPNPADGRILEWKLGEAQGHFSVSLYETGVPASIDLCFDKEGETVNGLLRGLSVTASLALQYGVPSAEIISQWQAYSFPPAGSTGTAISDVRSVLDYAASFLEMFPAGSLRISPESIVQEDRHRFCVGGMEGMLTVGVADKPRQISIQLLKQGNKRQFREGICQALGDTASLALRYDVPLIALIQEWKGRQFEPTGFTENKDIPIAKSVLDYAARYLELHHG